MGNLEIWGISGAAKQLCLWLIGGTEDRATIERLLLNSDLPLTLIVTVTAANTLS